MMRCWYWFYWPPVQIQGKVLTTIHCTVYSVICIMYGVQCSVCGVQCTPVSYKQKNKRAYPYQSTQTNAILSIVPVPTVNTVRCIVYIVHCTVYTVHYTVYTVHCTHDGDTKYCIGLRTLIRIRISPSFVFLL